MRPSARSDFASGTVVHMSSGWSALVLCLLRGQAPWLRPARFLPACQPRPHDDRNGHALSRMVRLQRGQRGGRGRRHRGRRRSVGGFYRIAITTAVADGRLAGRPNGSRTASRPCSRLCSGAVAGLVVVTPRVGLRHGQRGGDHRGCLPARSHTSRATKLRRRLRMTTTRSTPSPAIHGVGGNAGGARHRLRRSPRSES